jgi:response regulator RpfG family c-di-GMP phosphodiesterase
MTWHSSRMSNGKEGPGSEGRLPATTVRRAGRYQHSQLSISATTTRMHTDTPQGPGAPTITSIRRAVREAVRAVDTRWRSHPEDLTPGSERERVLAPLLAAAGRVAEPGAVGHMHGVGTLAEEIALAAGWDPECAAELRIHGALHDIGKLCISAAILTKPGPLTPDERRAVEQHPTLGRRLLAGSSSPLMQTAARVAGEHHEHWDGTGYPHGLAGDSIHPCARVIAIADVYDALTSTRPYRAALPADAALRIMERGRGSQFDPSLFDAFVSVVFADDRGCGRAAA